MTTIKVGLQTVDGRACEFFLTDDKPDGTEPVWIDGESEGDGETESATFEVLADDGSVEESDEVDGFEWREIESGGGAGQVHYWVARGVPLDSAVAAAIDCSDPCGFDSDYEEVIDTLKARIAELEAAAAAPTTLYRFQWVNNGLGVWVSEWHATREEAEKARAEWIERDGLVDTPADEAVGTEGQCTPVEAVVVQPGVAGLLAFANTYAMSDDPMV